MTDYQRNQQARLARLVALGLITHAEAKKRASKTGNSDRTRANAQRRKP